MKTGIQLILFPLLFMFLMFTIFAYMPSTITSEYSVSSSTLNKTYEFNPDPSQDYTNADNTDIFDVIKGLYSFSLNGVPWWLNILCVYLPTLMIIFGVYCVIRGI